MTKFKYVLLVSGLCGALLGLRAYSANPEEGQALAKSKGCFECHGKSGNTFWNDSPPPMPKIAGMPKNYLISAMKDYRSGSRQNKEMTPMMSNRTNEEIELLADYYSSQERY